MRESVERRAMSQQSDSATVDDDEIDDDAQLNNNTIDLEESLRDAEASPVVTLVDRILLQAMSVSASDIHVEPQQKGLRLRYRQDGVLRAPKDGCGV